MPNKLKKTRQSGSDLRPCESCDTEYQVSRFLFLFFTPHKFRPPYWVISVCIHSYTGRHARATRRITRNRLRIYRAWTHPLTSTWPFPVGKSKRSSICIRVSGLTRPKFRYSDDGGSVRFLCSAAAAAAESRCLTHCATIAMGEPGIVSKRSSSRFASGGRLPAEHATDRARSGAKTSVVGGGARSLSSVRMHRSCAFRHFRAIDAISGLILSQRNDGNVISSRTRTRM